MYLSVAIEAGVVKILVALQWGGSRCCGGAIHDAAMGQFAMLRWGSSRCCGDLGDLVFVLQLVVATGCIYLSVQVITECVAFHI